MPGTFLTQRRQGANPQSCKDAKVGAGQSSARRSHASRRRRARSDAPYRKLTPGCFLRVLASWRLCVEQDFNQSVARRPSPGGRNLCRTALKTNPRSGLVAVRKDRHQDVGPTGLEVWENRVATKIPLLTELRKALEAPRHPLPRRQIIFQHPRFACRRLGFGGRWR